MLAPEDFDCGLEPPDGGKVLEDGTREGWRILDIAFATNPKYLLGPADWEMLRLWQYFRPDDGIGHLPEAGGVMDQAAVMMDAFAVMDWAYARLRRKDAHLA